MLNDLRHALRLLVKAPGFTITAVIVLALGIGLNTAMFSLIHALAFSGRTFAEPDRVLQLFSRETKDKKQYRPFSYPAYTYIRDRTEVFQGVLAHNLTMVGVGAGRDSRRSFSAIVSANYFEVLGVRLARGRTFSAEEGAPNAAIPVAIASHQFWKKSGARADFVGSVVTVNERPYTIIGIAPEGFTGTMMMIDPELYFPFGVFDVLNNDTQPEQRHALDRPNGYNLYLVARLKDGVTAENASASLEVIARQLEERYPVEHKDQTLILGTLPRLSTSTEPSSDESLSVLGALLLGMTAIVLLVVCLNLAGLLLARGHARRKEIAIRLALGGGRFRIVRQLLTEGLVLAILGSLGGLVLANGSADFLIRSLESLLPIRFYFPGASSSAVLGATAGFCLLATVFFALGPALKLSRSEVLSDLKHQAGEDARTSRSRWMPRHPLVVAQIALSLALLISAGLFVRMAYRVTRHPTGYQADQTLLVEVDASLGGLDEGRSLPLYLELESKLAALPGVETVSLASVAPYGFLKISRPVKRAGINPGPGSRPATAAEGLAYSASWNSVGADYFKTMGLPLLRGRAFQRGETTTRTANPGVIVDEVLARKLWPDGDALGQRVEWGERDAMVAASDESSSIGASRDLSGQQGQVKVFEIIGIVPATRASFFQKEPSGAIYVPYAHGFLSNSHFHIRVKGPEGTRSPALIESIRSTVRTAAPGVPLLGLRTFRHHLDASVEFWIVRVGAALFTLFGASALLVAVVGVYGIKSYAVSRRTREIGVRMALGAEPGQVQRMILREGMAMTALGLACGGVMGAAIGRLFSGLFSEVQAFDPLSFLLAAAGLALAALLACWIPARRVVRVDPVLALRTE
ncbi:MAG: ABC transporter permease [Opitutaceae bacterium]